MARGTFKPEKPAKNTEKVGVFNKAVNDLRPTTMDDSANADAWAKHVNQIGWEKEAYKSDDPNATS